MIIIEPYNPTWPQEFERMRAALQAVLGADALRIDHIGSTSVPGVGAKDVIDIQITVRALTPALVQKLVAAGYTYPEELSHDHGPLGENDAPRLWEKRFLPSRLASAAPTSTFASLGTPTSATRCCFETTCARTLAPPGRSS